MKKRARAAERADEPTCAKLSDESIEPANEREQERANERREERANERREERANERREERANERIEERANERREERVGCYSDTLLLISTMELTVKTAKVVHPG